MTKIKKFIVSRNFGIAKVFGEPDSKSVFYYGPVGTLMPAILAVIEFGLTGRKNQPLFEKFNSASTAEYFTFLDEEKLDKVEQVELELCSDSMDEPFTVTRSIKWSEFPTIEPDNYNTRKIFDELSTQQLIVLSRQSIFNFWTMKPVERGEWFEKAIGKIYITDQRNRLKINYESALFNAKKSWKSPAKVAKSSRRAVLNHFQIDKVTKNEILKVVNRYRKKINLKPLTVIPKNQYFLQDDVGNYGYLLTNVYRVLRSLRNFSRLLITISRFAFKETDSLVDSLSKLKSGSKYLVWARKQGLSGENESLTAGARCMGFMYQFQENDSIQNRISFNSSNKPIQQLWKSIDENTSILVHRIDEILKHVSEARGVLERIGENNFMVIFDEWVLEMENLKVRLRDPIELLGLHERLQKNWAGIPNGLRKDIIELIRSIEFTSVQYKNKKRFDEKNPDEVVEFLKLAQEYYQVYLRNVEKLNQAKKEVMRKQNAYTEYCELTDIELNKDCEDIDKYFHFFFRNTVGEDSDISPFDLDVKLHTKAGELHIYAGNYDRSSFPSASLSEGIQNVMVICLYLAVMKRVNKGDISIILIDDILSLIDEDYQKRIYQLLIDTFPHAQFITAIYESTMRRQIKKIDFPRKEIQLYGWEIGRGPKTGQKNFWQERLANVLNIYDTRKAAHQLRYHLVGLFYNLAWDYRLHVNLPIDHLNGFDELKVEFFRSVQRFIEDGLRSVYNSDCKSDYHVVQKFANHYFACVEKLSNDKWQINKAIENGLASQISEQELDQTIITYTNLFNNLWCPRCNSWLDLKNFSTSPSALECIRDHMELDLK